MKTQIFLNGNKRASIIFANHYLISHGGSIIDKLILESMNEDVYQINYNFFKNIKNSI